MGQRGPKPGSGGRPKKPIADKIADGNPGKRPLTVIDFKDSAADLEGQPMPKPSEFLSAKQKDGSTLCAAEIYENVWNHTENYGDELMNYGLITSDVTAGEVPGNVTPCTDFESRIYMLKGKKVQEGR